MMTYTRSAIGLLTRQYRSVLKKCFLINMGLFALGAVGAVSMANAAVPTPTLDDMNTKAENFTSSQKYNLTTTQDTNTNFLLLDNGSGTLTQYWYTPIEGTVEKNNILNYLAGVALAESDSSDYVFTNGTKYYKFDMSKSRPVSGYAWNETGKLINLSEGTSADYDFAVNNGGSTKYYNIAIDLTKASHVGSKLSNINWSTSNPSGYTWVDYVAASNATVSGDTITGAIRLKTSHNGSVPTAYNVWDQYFTYTYTKPSGYDITQTGVKNTVAADGSNVQSKAFVGISEMAVYNAEDLPNADIIADFINNRYKLTSKGTATGGAIFNFYNIGNITGDFVGNYVVSTYSGYASFGGAIYNTPLSSVSTIRNITGDFVGNTSYSYGDMGLGGAILNRSFSNYTASIGNITGYFIYNRSSGKTSHGGAISNYSYRNTSIAIATIGSIAGGFIGNSASSSSEAYGGAISNYSYYNSPASINSITGDFIGNSVSGSTHAYGGAISNYSYNGTPSISSITGDFIGNSASSSSSFSSVQVFGGAICNNGTIGSIVGNFVGNYAQSPSSSANDYGGAIYNGPSSPITLAGNTFIGNYVRKRSTITPNSIYNAGTINIADGATVTINDGYDGLSNAQLNVGTGSNFNLSVDNGELQTDNLGTVTNNGAINWDLDVQFNGASDAESDKITLTSLSGTSSIIINAINLMVEPTSVYTVNVATGGSDLANALTITGGTLKTQGATQWWDVTYTSADGLLHFAPGTAPVADALLTANATSGTRSFGDPELSTVTSVHTLTDDLTGTAAGDFTINGTKSGTGSTAARATIDLDSHKGFDLANETTLNINNTKVTNGADNIAIAVSNASAKVNLDGAYIDGKITSTAAYDLTTAGETVLNGDVTAGTLTVTSGELKNNGASTVGGGSNAGIISGTGSLTTTGAFENKSGATISQAVSHSGTGTNAFTNKGTISGAVTNSGVFANNSSITGAVTNSGTFNNTGTISGAVTNTGTMTSAAEKMTGTIANNGTGVLNLSGALAKNISGTGTTNVDSALALNSGAGIAGTLAMDTSDTLTVSSGAITEHTIGEIKGTGNIALDINYGETITSDKITVTNDTQAATLKITALNETGTRAANFEKQILFGTNGNTKLDVSGLSGWNGSTDKEAEVALTTSGTIAYNENYGTHKWTETTALTVIGSAEGLYDTLKYTTTISNDRFDPKAENLTVINQYSGTGSDDRKINFAGIQEAAGGTYTMKASTSLGETKAGKMTLDGEKNTTTKALTVVNLNGNAGYNLTKATELVLDEVKLTNASGNVITASNDSAKVTLNDAYVDGNIAKTGTNKMTVTTSGNTTLNGNTSNVNLSNSGTLTNNGTITGNVTNSGTLNSSMANITGTITNNSTFNLSGDISKNIAGTGTTVLQSATSTVAADRTISGTLNANGKNIAMQDDAYETLTVGNLSGNANITINAKASSQESDKINISSGTSNSSALTISALNLDTTGLAEGVDCTKTMSVVSGTTSGVSLAFDDNLDLSDYNRSGIAVSDLLGTDSVTDKDVAWDETFGDWKQTRKKNTSLTISGTNMVYKETNYTVGPKVFTSYAEGLKELNQFASTDTKTFNAATSGTEHKIIEDLGNTVGKVSIDGKGGTLDFDGHEGFVMASGTEVSLKDVTAKNADGLADIKAGATLNLQDVTLEDNGILQSAGTINLNGSNSIDSIIAGTSTSAVLNVNSDWDMDTTVTGHTVNVNGKKLTVSAGKLVASDSLNAKSGSEVDIANNKVNLDQVKFESGSKLNLKVDSLNNFGAVNANNITIENGANLSATLAQGIVKIGQKETLQLLKADNSNFNNFADSFDNEMYHFEKADKNGAYNISQVKTAEEVVEETGGTSTEVQAAAAWVDGDQFEEGTTAAKVADAMADLAQNEPKEFTKALSVVAPQEAPKAQSELTELSDKLLLTVGKYLSNQDIGGLSSGDALQDVTIWAKGYYGESKLSNHGKVKGFDSKNKGVIAGFDKKLNKAVKVGAGFQYNDSDVDAYHRDVEVDSLVGFVYGEYRPSKWFVSGVASFGKADYDEEKHALGIKIKDNYSANVYSLQALTGYDFKYVTPEIGARYYRIKRHGYEDNIGQSVSGKDMDILRGVFGLRSSYEFGMFKPEVYAGITYDFVSDKDNALVSLPNGSSYTVDGKRLKRFGTEFSANVTAQVTDNTKIGAGYEGKFREHYQDHTGMISVKYEF